LKKPLLAYKRSNISDNRQGSTKVTIENNNTTAGAAADKAASNMEAKYRQLSLNLLLSLISISKFVVGNWSFTLYTTIILI